VDPVRLTNRPSWLGHDARLARPPNVSIAPERVGSLPAGPAGVGGYRGSDVKRKPPCPLCERMAEIGYPGGGVGRVSDGRPIAPRPLRSNIWRVFGKRQSGPSGQSAGLPSRKPVRKYTGLISSGGHFGASRFGQHRWAAAGPLLRLPKPGHWERIPNTGFFSLTVEHCFNPNTPPGAIEFPGLRVAKTTVPAPRAPSRVSHRGVGLRPGGFDHGPKSRRRPHGFMPHARPQNPLAFFAGACPVVGGQLLNAARRPRAGRSAGAAQELPEVFRPGHPPRLAFHGGPADRYGDAPSNEGSGSHV
jgi:hypothetical protein